MQEATSIRILEKDNNRRGDLFGCLMADLFIALGYEQPRINIHKSGRELDLSANHRLEPRRAIAECKATLDTIGGDDLNKFVGVLDAEQGDNLPVTGYFISLSGFKETAIEQEKGRRRTKIITLTGPQVVGELVRGRILVAMNRATELAGRYCAALRHLTLDTEAELLAHERGWIWAIYYTQGKDRTHFALIHSDGTPLARAIANEVVAADKKCGGNLDKLSCLNPVPAPETDDDPRFADALMAYRQYLSSECGFIQLDGLPADNDIGSRRLRLESLFVPLHFDMIEKVGGEQKKRNRQSIGPILTKYQRLALLAAPGGGKSTLIKRLATAYADPARLGQLDDDLPHRDWIPLFFRCRELRSLTRGSFADLIEALSQREPVRQHAGFFRAYVDRALLAGRVLLLVDGLDEIADPGDRAAFVCTLRAALQAYPDIAIVVTSREAGFRHVASHLAPVCTQVTLSPFDKNDVRRLSVAWHREVVGDTEKVRADAEQLALTITQNDRINRLAVNPLLLTTLLLVKRWVGALPTRRSVLYGKAVEVLLMTWNTEGHEPIPEEEALPQLCYVASAMMLAGVQKISRPKLASLLQEARDALPTELGYVKGAVDEFIHRVEDRSSLLMMAGIDVEDGRLAEFYEFRHLTFQEFLTARAMVEGWHPGRKDDDTLVRVLEPHFEEEQWREVIPLAAVLGGKATEALIQRLTERSHESEINRDIPKASAFLVNLVDCLADEAAARPETIRNAVRELVARGSAISGLRSIPMLVRGRYGAEFLNEAVRAFQSSTDDLANPGDALLVAVWWQSLDREDSAGYFHATELFIEKLQAGESIVRCEGALGIGQLCQMILREPQDEYDKCIELLNDVGQTLLPMIDESPQEACCALFALSSLGEREVWEMPFDPDLYGRIFSKWLREADMTLRHLAVRTLLSQPLLPRGQSPRYDSISLAEVESLLARYDECDALVEQQAILVLAWHFHVLDNDAYIQGMKAYRDNNKGAYITRAWRESQTLLTAE